MPYTYKSPGVYVEEVAKGPRPIEAAGTSVLAIIGLCAQTVTDPDTKETVDTSDKPKLVTDLKQFFKLYGQLGDDSVLMSYLHHAVIGYFLNGGTAAYIVGLRISDQFKPKRWSALQLEAPKGALPNAAGQETLYLTAIGLQSGEEITVEVVKADEGTAEGAFSLNISRTGAEMIMVKNLTLNAKGKATRNVEQILQKEASNQLSARVAELQGSPSELAPVIGKKVTLQAAAAPGSIEDPAFITELKKWITPELFKGDAAKRTGLFGLEAVEDVTLLACPDLVGYPGVLTKSDVKDIQGAMLDHCATMKDRFAILDSPPRMGVQEIADWRQNQLGDSPYGALYYPWVIVRIAGDDVGLPPSGHIAGVYARVDAERGVHKAPANEVVRGITDVEWNVSRNEQDLLNPIEVNCVRAFPGQGIRIWGARTLASRSAAQWRYINVRRLFCNIEESILQSTRWIVFEPNDEILWRQISRDITAFLTVIWRSGALFGATPEEAFFVKCDRETNPSFLRDLGYCVIEVGLAPVKPAEFVVFKVSQKDDGSGTASE